MRDERKIRQAILRARRHVQARKEDHRRSCTWNHTEDIMEELLKSVPMKIAA